MYSKDAKRAVDKSLGLWGQIPERNALKEESLRLPCGFWAFLFAGLLSLLFCALSKAEPHRVNARVEEDAYLLEFSRAGHLKR